MGRIEGHGKMTCVVVLTGRLVDGNLCDPRYVSIIYDPDFASSTEKNMNFGSDFQSRNGSWRTGKRVRKSV